MRRTLFLVALAACGDSATIGAGYKTVVRTMTDPPTKLDVLFVIDDSVSITDDQQALIAAARTQLFPQLPADLHVGVVSTSFDVGPGFAGQVGGCTATTDRPFPNGKLLDGAWHDEQHCAMVTAPYLATDGTVANFTGDLEDAFACIAAQGHQGCGFEQPLEAMKLGLSLPENAGFLRDDAELLVVLLTDEDDSSRIDLTVLDDRVDSIIQGDREYEYGVDCAPDDVHLLGEHDTCVPRPNTTLIAPIDGYVAFLTTLKSDPAMVMVAGIAPPTGPVTTILNPFGNSGLAIASICTPPPGPCVDDPTMTCARDGVPPAIRLTAFAASFPGRYELPSICEAQTDEAVHRIARSVHNVMTNGTCVSGDVPDGRCRAMSVDASGARHAVPFAFVEDDDACDYTPSHLRADATPRTGEHLEVECL